VALCCLLLWGTALPAAEVLLQTTISSAPAGAGYVLVAVSRVAAERGPSRDCRQPLLGRLLLSRSGERPPTIAPDGSPLDSTHLLAGQALTCWVTPGAPGTQALPVSLAVVGPPEQAESGRRAWSRRANYNRWRYSSELSRTPVKVAMTFPVLGSVNWRQGYLAELMGQPHTGVDLSAPKLRALVACFDGYAVVLPDTPEHPVNTVVLVGDQGYTAIYTHLNDDTPGSNDGRGKPDQAFAPGLRTDARVKAGQLLGYVGDSGIATNPHLHFELRERAKGTAHDPAPSLKAAQKLPGPRVPPWLTALRPAAGEVRLDGFLRSVDLKRPSLFLDLVARTTTRGTSAVVRPETAGVRLTSSTVVRASGSEQSMVLLETLPLGLGVTVLATAERGTFLARQVHLDCGGFEPGSELARELDLLCRAVSG